MTQASQSQLIAIKATISTKEELERILFNVMSALPKAGPCVFDTVCYAVKRLRKTHEIALKKDTIMTACLISYQRVGKKLPREDNKLTLDQLIDKYKI